MGQVGVIFDCDGTLIDSMGAWHDLDDRLARRAGIDLTKADRDYMTAGTIEECSKYIHDKFGIGECWQDVEQIIYDDMLDYYIHDACLKPGAKELVEHLDSLGVPMGVASSTPIKLLVAGLEASGLAPYMKAIVSVDELNTSKRVPLIYGSVCGRLGTRKADTWVVEDAVYALKTANSGGFRTLSVYDSDIAGKPEDLEANSDMFVLSLEDVSAERLLSICESQQAGCSLCPGR